MIKFPTNQGDVMMETSKEALRECKHLERVQGSWKETQWRQREQQMSRIREQASLRSKSNSGRGLSSGPMPVEKTRSKENAEEIFTTSHEHPDEYVTMGVMLTNNCRQLLADILRENMEVDYSSLNKACAKDMYPFPKEEEELASSMGYPYKYFLRLLKEYIQIRMAEDDDEKAWMIENVLANQRGRNVEIYLEEIVIKSKSKLDLVQDVKETLEKLKRVNIKIEPVMSLFGVKEGRFLGHIVTEEELRTDLGRIHAIILSPTPRSPNQIGSLFLQLTAISKFIPKLAELKHPIREARTRMETTKESG
ncbi:hypothetical protein Tco_0378305 [Tanacetum coccineum]